MVAEANYTDPPSTADTVRALRAIAVLLGTPCCGVARRRFVFGVPGGTITLSPDSARRFRLDGCRGETVVARLWLLAGQDARLAGSVLFLKDLISADQADGGDVDEVDGAEGLTT